MKKILIIISTLILILLFENVKASTIKNYSTDWYDHNGVKYTQTLYSPTNFYGKSISRNANDSKSGSMYYRFNNTGAAVNLDKNPKAIYLQVFFYPTGSTMNSQQGATVDGTWYYNNEIGNSLNIQTFVYSNSSSCQPIGHNGSIWTYKCNLQTNSPYISGFNIHYYFDEQQADDTGSIYFIGISSNYSIEYDNNAAIVEQQQQTNDLLNETTQYNTQTNANTIGANETIEAGEMEDQLIQENEFNGSILEGMNINTNASGFIWQIMERLRGMNIAIVSLMTMALGLGVIKLVLNR